MPIDLVPEKFYVPPVGADTEIAESLPAISFWNETILERERETVFRDSWLCLPKALLREHNPDVKSIWVRPAPGHSHFDVLGQRGGSAKLRVLGESLVIFRGFYPKGAPELRCFKNMCPHARYPFLEITHDSDSDPYIFCPQHGLTCDEFGKFVSHRAFPNPTEKEKEKLCMTRYLLEDWFDFLFISRADKPAVPFKKMLTPLWECLSKMPLEEFKYRKTGPEQRVVDGNYKLHAQNYLDWLHIRDVHKKPNGLADSMDLASAHMELYDHSALMWAYAADPEDGISPEFLPGRFRDKKSKNPDSRRVYFLSWFIAPNLTLNFYKWGLSVNIYMPAMVDTERMLFDPEKTEFLWYHYVWHEDLYKEVNTRWMNELVDFEDIEAIRYTAENMRGRSHPWSRGLFGRIPEGPNTEAGPWWFNRWIYTRMFEPHAEAIVSRKRIQDNHDS